jgi:hypothetical protein
LYFARINGYAFTGDSVAQEFFIIQPKFTFGELGIQFVVPKTLENNVKMCGMLYFIFGIYEDIINEDHNELVKLGHEH